MSIKSDDVIIIQSSVFIFNKTIYIKFCMKIKYIFTFII